MRQLASIQKVVSVEPIEGSDFIEKIQILGWNLVAKKSEFQVGDLAVYCEIDSIMPDRPEFEFLKQNGKMQRIKTKKIRGITSQGVAFPIELAIDAFYNASPELFNGNMILNYKEGDDVTEFLGVIKYEPPEPFILGHSKGNFPSFLTKTDETRIQSIPRIIEEMNGMPYYIAEKVDGSSSTFYFRDGEYGVCSRNQLKQEDDKCTFWKISNKYNIRSILENTGRNLAIQGEVAGVGIQKNRLNLKDVQLFVFNVFDIDNGTYFNFAELDQFCRYYNLPMVKVIELNTSFEYKTVDELLEKAVGLYEGTNNQREGIVIRPLEETWSKVLKGRMSFKVVNNEYLLSGGT